MAADDPREWMWGQALDILARAERLRQGAFQPVRSVREAPTWTPPVDVLESDREVLIIAALPGVRESEVSLALDGACLVIAGQRALPDALRTAVIHRLELPQGRFERRVPLPAGRYDQIAHRAVDGCLLVSLRKAA
ncbi:MAG TPA: Hsp20/alpha crystallin family protein [Caulobacteraceae bacterium]|nr:Hsp20/alpha crystallin family protein [Caulobacteraceae bacterium]